MSQHLVGTKVVTSRTRLRHAPGYVLIVTERFNLWATKGWRRAGMTKRLTQLRDRYTPYGTKTTVTFESTTRRRTFSVRDDIETRGTI